MIGLALLLQVKPGPPYARDAPACAAVGLIAGFLAASTSVAGPPLVLLGLKQRWEPARFRATAIAYFFTISVFSLPFYWEMGLITPATWEFALYGLPAIAVGYFTGTWLRERVSVTAFRWFAMGVVVAGGLSAVLL